MGQFDVYRNDNPDSRQRVAYLLDVQTDLPSSAESPVLQVGDG